MRARIVLASSTGMQNKAIASELEIRRNPVAPWPSASKDHGTFNEKPEAIDGNPEAEEESPAAGSP